MEIAVELTGILINENADGQLVEISEKGNDKRSFPIGVGSFEATMLSRALNNEEIERPLTHNLLANLISQIGGLEKLVITGLRDHIFIGSLFVSASDGTKEIDCRPSDGLVIATILNAPIFVEERVFEQLQENWKI